jgi:hypothetical protein
MGDSSTHKRSSSDGQKLTNMFHFKQQMLLNKIMSTQSNKENNYHHTRVNSQNNSKGFVSGLASKRMSKEEQENIPHDNYSSPRSQIAAAANKGNQLKKSSDCEIFNEMKNFLTKFADQSNPVLQPKPTSNSNSR